MIFRIWLWSIKSSQKKQILASGSTRRASIYLGGWASGHEQRAEQNHRIIIFIMRPIRTFRSGRWKTSYFQVQGASLENFLYFKNLYKNAKLITLTENYRSHQGILDSTHSLMPDSSPLNSNTEHKIEKINIFPFETPESETYFVAHDIKRKITDGVAPEE